MKIDDDGVGWIGGQAAKVASALQHGEVHLVAGVAELLYTLPSLVGIPVDEANAVHGENRKSTNSAGKLY